MGRGGLLHEEGEDARNMARRVEMEMADEFFSGSLRIPAHQFKRTKARCEDDPALGIFEDSNRTQSRSRIHGK